MKKQIIAVVVALTIQSHARVGENMDQLVARYGSRPKIRAGKGCDWWIFTTEAWTVTVQTFGFSSATSKVETFQKRNGEVFTEDEVRDLILPTADFPRAVLGPILYSDKSLRWTYDFATVRKTSPSNAELDSAGRNRRWTPSFLCILEGDGKSFSIGPLKGWRDAGEQPKSGI